MSKSVRIDKFLWAVRLYKTRSKATDACKTGKVKVDNKLIKPSRILNGGESIQLRKGPITYSYDIVELLVNRVGAKLVPNYIKNTTSKEDLEKIEVLKLSYTRWRDRGKGRPTKKDRREIDDFDQVDQFDDENWDNWEDWEEEMDS